MSICIQMYIDIYMYIYYFNNILLPAGYKNCSSTITEDVPGSSLSFLSVGILSMLHLWKGWTEEL